MELRRWGRPRAAAQLDRTSRRCRRTPRRAACAPTPAQRATPRRRPKMVILLGLARRTARQIEKVSPFYLEEAFAFSQIEARMVAGFFRWNQPRERRERACPSLLEERVLREEPIWVPPNTAHPHVRHVERRIAVRRVRRFAVTRGQAGKEHEEFIKSANEVLCRWRLS